MAVATDGELAEMLIQVRGIGMVSLNVYFPSFRLSILLSGQVYAVSSCLEPLFLTCGLSAYVLYVLYETTRCATSWYELRL
jgi:hypothetical protein